MARTTYRYDMRTAKYPEFDRDAYAKAAPFLARLKRYRKTLGYMDWKTLRDKALKGDIEGAETGLLHLLRGGEESGHIDFLTDRRRGKGDGG